ncbi:DMT family transporter [Paenibacillus sp. UNC451MF]|uniref:DMT family transporter n=1 Tax=Paenibacillus sp. UNC451MF TaxID=1449063 RepID=UPI000490DFA8|nr:multidrug efflux SMR transporter [Paenibacillus sp. UNC451MF]
MAWIYVVLGGLMDVGWATGLKYTHSFTELIPSVLTILCIVVSFYLFTKSVSQLPIGTAYAVFTGIGAAGTVIVGMLFLGEPRDGLRIFFIIVLLAGLLGLKMSVSETDKPKSEHERN